MRFAHYRVLRRPDGSPWELGRGAMGVTYKAYDEELRVDVALKLITPAQVDDAKTQALFLREARAAARVHHSNVASVVHLSTTPGNFFYAMEFIAGESLADWLRVRGALPPLLGIGFAIQIARGLEAIHAQHIVHRDLKPGNLMIVPSGRGSRPGESIEWNPDAWQIKIIDFGLARGFGGEGPGTEVDAKTIGFRGTTLYASPEQCEEHRELDGRSDQYSLGCILWEMLTGAPPFRGRTHRELLNQHVALPLPLQRLAHLPDGLQVVLARMLAKDPAHRFADDQALVDGLERCRDRLVRGGERFEDYRVTTRDAERAADLASAPATAGNPAAGAVTSGVVPMSRARTVGIAIAGATLVVVGADLFFTRGRSTMPSPVASTSAPVDAVTTPAISPTPTPAVQSRKSIAVLPFENLSGRAEDAYLADGLQEEILSALARLRDLKVISRTSVMEYRGKTRNIRQIGQRLGAGTILEGSVRREGKTLRLTVQLIDASDDHHLLATSYDRELHNALDLQSTVARLVAESLAATLTRQERGDLDRVATNNGDAYDRYLRAVALFRQPVPDDENGLSEPKRLLAEALRLDPNYADAYALLSQANTWSYVVGGERPEDGTNAKQALEGAFANDPKSPDALLARGFYAMYVTKNLNQALADLDAVVKLRPNSAEAQQGLGLALRRSARMAEALTCFERAWDLDPLNGRYAAGAFSTLIGLRRYPETIQVTELDSARFPNEPESYFFRASLQARLLGSSEPLRIALREHGNVLDPTAKAEIESEIAQIDGRYLDAAGILAGLPKVRHLNPAGLEPGLSDEIYSSRREFYLGCLYQAGGNVARAEQCFRAAAVQMIALRRREPTQKPDPDDLQRLAIAQSMLGEQLAALVTIELARSLVPEARDATNGPAVSFVRSFILVRAGRTEEGYAEVARLLRVPFGAPTDFIGGSNAVGLLTRDDPRFDELINHPPRL